jgi:hypothetical protein
MDLTHRPRLNRRDGMSGLGGAAVTLPALEVAAPSSPGP